MNKSQIIPSHIAQNPNAQQRILQKTKLIELLQQKNSTLHKEIQRIAQMMEETSKQNEQKLNEEKRKEKVIQITNDPELLDRELKNCYKKIELYEYEVQKMKQKSISTNVSDKLTGMQTELKQKKLIEDRLKQELLTLERQIAQNSKKLSGNSHQQEIEKDLKKKADQLKFLKNMIKDYDSKDAIKQKNLKNEYTYLKKIEKEFVQSGGSMHELDVVKHKALSQIQQGRFKPVGSKDSSSDQYYDRFNKSNSKSIQNQGSLAQNNPSMVNPQSEVIEDRTKTNYEALMNELSLLEKLNKKYEKQLDESEKFIGDVEGKTELTKKRLEKVQTEIEDFNQLIRLKKTCIVAENMKPTHRKSVQSVNAKADLLNISERKEPPNKRKRNIINLSAIGGDIEQRLYHI